jgi:hypothetical protein
MPRTVERLALRIREVYQISARRLAILSKACVRTVTVQKLPSKLARINRRQVK